MSGDIQPRKRKGKGKKKDEAEDEIFEGKGKAVANNSHKASNNGSSGEGSGIVAKIIFLILLVALSVVIGLILIELRGKHVGLEPASVVPKAEEQSAPEIPTPSLHEDEEPVPVPPAPTIESEVEEFDNLEATPPLEEYIRVVPGEEDAPTEETEPTEKEAEVLLEEPVVVKEVIEEVVEIVEELPVEIVKETEEVKEVEDIEEEIVAVEEEAAAAALGVEEVAEAVAAISEDAEVVEESEEPVLEEDTEEIEEAPVESEELAAPEVEEPKEEAPVLEEETVSSEEEEKEEEEEEEAAPLPPVEEVVEEPIISETVEEVQAPLQHEEESIPAPDDQSLEDDKEDKEVDSQENDDDDDDEDNEDKDDEEEESEGPKLEEEDDDDSDEDWSQYGKEGGAGALTDAYLRVETLAEEVLHLDPENSMVNQLAPHLSGVLRAMEEGRTEGLLDTLSHIQVILEDVKRRIEEPSPGMETTQQTEESSEPVKQTEPEPIISEDEPMPVVEAEAEPEPVVEAEAEPEPEPEPVVEAEAEPEPEPVLEAEPEAVVEAETEPIVETEAAPELESKREPVSVAEAESDSVAELDASEEVDPEVESEPAADSEPAAVAFEPEPVSEVNPVEEVIIKEKEAERVFPLDPVEVPEEVLANIEAEIIPHEEVAAVEKEDISIPSLTETNTVFPPKEEEEGEKPVPVDEVIPDPVYIKPLQESGVTQEEAAEDSKAEYENADITSGVDNDLREELDTAEKVKLENPRDALNIFGTILLNNPKSARALYGRAQCLDLLAEIERSNSKLEQAIVTYRGVMDLADEDPSLVPLPLFRMAAEKCIDRMHFRGFFGKAVRVQQRLLQRFPDDLALRNQMGVTFLLMNQATAAKEVFETILEKWPEDGFAQVHYGFILKTTYNNNTAGADYMRKGIESQAEGTQDGRFFFHLGDALQREGMTEQAYKVYDIAVEKGLFLNRYQRSLYNVDRLASKPVWEVEQTSYTDFFRKLEANWEVIRDEGVALLSESPQEGFRPEAENLQDTGDWKQYELFSRGRKITANCVKASKTCALVQDFPPAASCKRGQVKFSVMQPNTHVHAHTGPTNCRLRAHLGLVVPPDVHMRVGDTMLKWEEGKIVVFDDSWEHEVWHNGTTVRLVLIVDVWHPDLNDHEKKSLSPI